MANMSMQLFHQHEICPSREIQAITPKHEVDEKAERCNLPGEYGLIQRVVDVRLFDGTALPIEGKTQNFGHHLAH